METGIPTLPTNMNKKNWRVWWNITRPHTLTASFVPVLLGTVMSLELADFHFGLFFAMLIASVMIQIATNLFNEYYDFKRGLDNEESVGIGGAIVREGIPPKMVLNLAQILIALSVLLGVYISANSSWWIALIGSICILVGYLYTGGPLPISSTPLGEVFSGVFMGTIIILISFYIQTGTITTTSVLVSVPIAILIGSINLANNIRDMDGDKAGGRKTLPVLVGRKNAIKILAGAFIISYAWIVGLVLLQYVSPWLLIIFISVIKPIMAVKQFQNKTKPIQMMPAMKSTAQTNTIFGLLLSVGYLISYLFS